MGLEDFDVLQSLGAGHFAKVDKVKRKLDDKIYALKRLNVQDIPPKDLEDSLNEIRILVSFKHPRIIRCYETFFTDDSSELCIVMEYCPFGDLDQKIRRFYQRRKLIDEREIWVYAINILEGLVALHQKGVVHRDLKPANCLIDAVGCVKIADMNISKVSKGVDMKSQVGTPYFMSPEIYLKQPYSTTSDIWSLGCVLYDLAAQRPPFHADSIHNLKKAVIKGSYEPIPSVYSADLTTIITKFMALNPTDRPEAKDALQDPIIASHKYLLRYPLRPEDEMSEGELFPTIRVAPDPVNENAKLITLPAPAYDDTGDGMSFSSGSPGPSGASPSTPSRLGQRSASYSIILSPRRNTTTKGGAPASPKPTDKEEGGAPASGQENGGPAALPGIPGAQQTPATPTSARGSGGKSAVPKIEGINAGQEGKKAGRSSGTGEEEGAGTKSPRTPGQVTSRRESGQPTTARGSGPSQPASARRESSQPGTGEKRRESGQPGTGEKRRESTKLVSTARGEGGVQTGTMRGEKPGGNTGTLPPASARGDGRAGSYLPTIADAPDAGDKGRASGVVPTTGEGEGSSPLAEMRKMFNRNVTARLTRGASEKEAMAAAVTNVANREQQAAQQPQQQQPAQQPGSSRDLLGRARGLWSGGTGGGGGSSMNLLNRNGSIRLLQPQHSIEQPHSGGTLGS